MHLLSQLIMPYDLKYFPIVLLSTKILRKFSATKSCKSFTSVNVSLTSELLQKVKESQSDSE